MRKSRPTIPLFKRCTNPETLTKNNSDEERAGSGGGVPTTGTDKSRVSSAAFETTPERLSQNVTRSRRASCHGVCGAVSGRGGTHASVPPVTDLFDGGCLKVMGADGDEEEFVEKVVDRSGGAANVDSPPLASSPSATPKSAYLLRRRRTVDVSPLRQFHSGSRVKKS